MYQGKSEDWATASRMERVGHLPILCRANCIFTLTRNKRQFFLRKASKTRIPRWPSRKERQTSLPTGMNHFRGRSPLANNSAKPGQAKKLFIKNLKVRVTFAVIKGRRIHEDRHTAKETSAKVINEIVYFFHRKAMLRFNLWQKPTAMLQLKRLWVSFPANVMTSILSLLAAFITFC